MKSLNKFKILIVFLVINYSCGVNNQDSKLDKKDTEIKVIKFMRSVNDYPRPIDETSFWKFPEEHATLKIISSTPSFLEYIKNIKNDTLIKYTEPNYAFLFHSGKNIDTLYSDYSLKNWILKTKGITKHFYDEKGVIGEEFRTRYSFFKDCW